MANTKEYVFKGPKSTLDAHLTSVKVEAGEFSVGQKVPLTAGEHERLKDLVKLEASGSGSGSADDKDK